MKRLEAIVATVMSGLFLHLLINIALLLVAYLVYGNERLVDDWTNWRDEHLPLVGAGTAVIVWAYFWVSSPETVRRFLTAQSSSPTAR